MKYLQFGIFGILKNVLFTSLHVLFKKMIVVCQYFPFVSAASNESYETPIIR